MKRQIAMEQTEFELRQMVDDLQRLMRTHNDTVKKIEQRMMAIGYDNTAERVHEEIGNCWDELDDAAENLLSLLEDVENENDPTPGHAHVE